MHKIVKTGVAWALYTVKINCPYFQCMSGEPVQSVWYQAGDFEMKLQQPFTLCYAASLKKEYIGCDPVAVKNTLITYKDISPFSAIQKKQKQVQKDLAGSGLACHTLLGHNIVLSRCTTYHNIHTDMNTSTGILSFSCFDAGLQCLQMYGERCMP